MSPGLPASPPLLHVHPASTWHTPTPFPLMTTAWGRLMVVMGLREPWGKTGHQGAGGAGGIMGEK